MSWVKEKKAPVNLDEFEDIDEDALVEALSPEELADLNAAIDPEVRVMIEVILFWELFDIDLLSEPIRVTPNIQRIFKLMTIVFYRIRWCTVNRTVILLCRVFYLCLQLCESRSFFVLDLSCDSC